MLWGIAMNKKKDIFYILSAIFSLLKRELGDKADFVTELSYGSNIPIRRKNICHVYLGNVEENSDSGERTIGVKLDIYLKSTCEVSDAVKLAEEIVRLVSSHGMVISSVVKYNPSVKKNFLFVPCEIKLKDYILPREYHISADGETLFDAACFENVSLDFLVRQTGAEGLLQTGKAVKLIEER